MFMKVGKRFGWLAGLALAPVVEGQEIIRDPEDATVCVGEVARFTSETDATATEWLLNGIFATKLPPEEYDLINDQNGMNTPNGTRKVILTIDYNPIFNGVRVQTFAVLIGGSAINSTAAYLFYEPNQQFKVTGLIGAVNNGTAQFYWNKLESKFNLTTHYLLGVYDSDGNLISNQTTDTTHISYNLPPRANDTCQYLEFKVTANQCPDPESPFIQTEGTTIDYREPNIDVSPVTAEFDNNQTVWVSWTPDGDSAFQIVVTDLGSGNQTAYNGTSPFSYTPPRCGQHSLGFEVSPGQCAGEPGFTDSDTIRLTIPCPTTATEPTTTTEADATDQPSGAQASYPSLLAVAAVIPLLKWQH